MVSQITWMSLLLMVGSVIIQGRAEPMARPMRPKVFTSPEELRKYLELIKDYYNLNGKARYGKRSLITTSGMNNPSDTLRMILDLSRQNQRDREVDKENVLLSNGELIREKTLSTRLDTNKPQIQDEVQRLSYPYNFLSKYYRDIE